ncbi:MAG: hypothetical protein CVV05_00870 [Gammaproteobacteria bacterium HGW-Gammaproteobacteria-1]|jgi:hypothetical protein|nr:MAG: hypothetical protein CVV05_00870 [Gammaproteobacteria bacterium HGW-Gammaproteobacteria-1]
MMITHNKHGSIKSLPNGRFRAYRASTFWIGDLDCYRFAARALAIASSVGAEPRQRGYYINMAASEDEHQTAVIAHDPFFQENPVTESDVRCTILPGEHYHVIGGCIPVVDQAT